RCRRGWNFPRDARQSRRRAFRRAKCVAAFAASTAAPETEGTQHGRAPLEHVVMSLETARRVLKIEAQAIQDVMARLNATFEKAVEILFACKGRVVVSGIDRKSTRLNSSHSQISYAVFCLKKKKKKKKK